MKELERLRAQNKILREMLETFINATDPDSENTRYPYEIDSYVKAS